MYISLFNGKKDPNKILKDWGEQGPLIGPVTISWTYGHVKIHDPEHEDVLLHLINTDDTIELNGMFYGDFEILEDNNEIVLKGDRKVLSFKDVQLLYKWKQVII